ncbi:MAG TPA: VCBS repeat-containing protein [Pyrinomonadaceae bacterium]
MNEKPAERYLGKSTRRLALAVITFLSTAALLAPSFWTAKVAGLCPDPSFNSAPTLPIAGIPRAVTTGDLNRDGKVDLVVASGFLPDANISIRLGSGNGSFADPVRLDDSVGIVVAKLALADFNLDGNLDLAATTGALVLRYGNGQGGFSPPVTFNGAGRAIAVADFNNDGLPDVATTSEGLVGSILPRVSVFIGQGAGGFSGPTVFELAPSYAPDELGVADVNGDNKLDLLVAQRNGGGIARLFGDGTGNFSLSYLTVTGFNITMTFKIADFNNDNKADIISASGAGNDVNLMLGNGNGEFPTKIELPNLSAQDLVVGDFNLDGKSDFAVARRSGVAIMLGNGDGTFARRDYAAGAEPSALTLDDFNNDAKPDLLVLNSQSNDFSILIGDGLGKFSAARTYSPQDPSSPTGIVTADFNGDGQQDFAVASLTSPRILVFMANGQGEFAPTVVYNVHPILPKSLAVADFNTDGKLDLAFLHGSDFSGKPIGILRGNGDGTFLPVISFVALVSLPTWLTAGDLNNDGRPDLCILAGDRLYTLINNGINFTTGSGFSVTQNIQVGVGNFSTHIRVADLNGDGKADMLVPVTELLHQRLWIGFGDGNGGITSSTTISFASIQSVDVGDFNQDGKPDLAVTGGFAIGQGGVLIFMGDGNGGFTFREGIAAGSGWVEKGDFNGDGKLDLVAGGLSAVSVLSGLGTGSFSVATNYGVGVDPKYLATGDFNGDGKSDIAAANVATRDVTVMLTVPCIAAPPSPTPSPSPSATPTPSPSPAPEATPVLLTEENSNRAIVMDSVTMVSDVIQLQTLFNFSSDHRTRIMLFAYNVTLMPGEGFSVVSAQAENAQHTIFQLPVEYVGPVNGHPLTQIVVRLPDGLTGDVLVKISFRGVPSNQAQVRIGSP